MAQSQSRIQLPVVMSALVLLLLSGCVVGDDNPEATPTATATLVVQVKNPRPTSTTAPSPTMTATTGAESTATPTPRPWPENCEPAQVDAFVQRVIDAFNSGDTEAMRGLLPDEDIATKRNLLLATASVVPAAVEGVPVALEWFAMPQRAEVESPPADGDYFSGRTVDEVLAFVAESHAAGFSMHLHNVMHSHDWLPTTVAFGVDVTLQIPGEAALPMLGKAGVDCGQQRLFVWSLGAGPPPSS